MNSVETKLDKSAVTDRSAAAGEPGWLTAIRGGAFERYSGMDWPQPDEEEWRRTSLESVDLDDERVLSSLLSAPSGPAGGEADGQKGYAYRLANLGEIDPAIYEKARPLLEKAAANADNRFAALNWCRWNDGILVYIPSGVEVEEPIVVDYSGSDAGAVNSLHTVVILGEGASATVVQTFSGGAETGLWNAMTTAEVGDGARLSLAGSQEVPSGADFFAHYTYFLGKDSKLDSFESYTGSKLTKSRNEVFLGGSGGEARLNGIYFTRDGQHMDMRTVQYHQERSGQSRALFKGAVSGSGRSIYQGLIDVDKKAVGTDAYLTNNNLILNDGARADSIPCLEIRTDDVKCSHGSTSGKLDEESLFYLMTRGLSRDEAKKELISGYFEDAVRNAPEIMRERLTSRITDLVG